MKTQTNLTDFGQAWWGEAKKKVKNAAVFLDSVSCECLHWNGGAQFLFDAGATCIKEFSAFETIPELARKAVFIVSSAFHGINLKILENLIKKSKLEYCIIITAAHVSVHHLLRWGGGREGQELEAFSKLEEDVLNWMGNMNYTVEVFYYPVCTIQPATNILLIPPSKNVMPILSSSLQSINEQLSLFSKGESHTVRSVNDLTFGCLPLEMQANVRQLVHNLNQILQHINGKEEIYSVGSFSRITGIELEALSAAKLRRKTAGNKVSVIFVDRALDLATVTTSSSVCWFDRFLQTLPKLHNFSNDVAVPMTSSSTNDLTTIVGCTAPQGDFLKGWKLMDELFFENCPDALKKITSDLNENSNLQNEKFSDILNANEKNWKFIERSTHLYQISKAIQQSKLLKKEERINRLEGLRKSLIEFIDEEEVVSPLIQVLHLFRTRKELDLSLDDILVLLIHLYSISGELAEKLFSPELEDRVQSILAEAIVEENENLSDCLQDFVSVPVDEMKAHRAAQKMFSNLRHLAETRSSMKRYKTVFRRGSRVMPIECYGLLQQIVEDIFDPALLENPDLESRSAGLKDLIKTGFSLFVNVKKPKPVDNQTIIIYICGGVRPDEIKVIEEILRQKSPTHNVIIASSHFVSSHDSLDYILKKS